MANLYLTEQGSVLRKTGERIVVQKDDEVLLDVPCSKIEAVLIFGNVQFTTQAVHELLTHGVEMAILSRTGKLLGQITSPFTRNIDLRIDQFKRHSDEGFRLAFARSIVAAKAENCLAVMRAFSYNHPEAELKEDQEAIQRGIDQIPCAHDIPSLMGIEGIIARAYFNGYGRMVLREFFFEGRKKYPPPDPVNALLSLGYTMIFNEILSLLDGLGFDPYLGYFHSPEYGRASLASDLVEEFRAVIDRFTLFLINDSMVKQEDFYPNPKGEGVYLKRDSLKRYFQRYEELVTGEIRPGEDQAATTIRKAFRQQAESLAHYIRGEGPYIPFRLEG